MRDLPPQLPGKNEICARLFACPCCNCTRASLIGKEYSTNIGTVKGLVSIVIGLCPLIAWAQTVELRGRVVCDVAANDQQGCVFKTDEGKTYKLVRAKLSEALFVDKRLREKDLLLKGTLSSDSQSFEPTAIHSLKNGVVHEVYYWCEICAIESVAPEICVCCQGPVELVEKPLMK